LGNLLSAPIIAVALVSGPGAEYHQIPPNNSQSYSTNADGDLTIIDVAYSKNGSILDGQLVVTSRHNAFDCEVGARSVLFKFPS
jgi:hypothetical protein